MLGACYLAYLGVRSLRAARTDGHEPAGDSHVQGLTVDVLDPQVALFFLAFLPGFAAEQTPALGMLLLGGL